MDKKRVQKFFVTVQEVNLDRILGEAQSFAIYDDEFNGSQKELVEKLVLSLKTKKNLKK